MRKFDYESLEVAKLDNDIVKMLNAIYEHKGRSHLFIEQKPEILETLFNIAKIQSTQSSNRIEGIFTSEKRVADLINEKTTPQNRNEEEIAGYRDVLSLIHTSFADISIRPNNFLQMHKILYSYSTDTSGGKFKSVDNTIEEISSDGRTRTRFIPMPAYLTPIKMDELCRAYNENADRSKINPLILAFNFILDFLCIHPFKDGNGRMSRLLTLLLLYLDGHTVGKYISIEKIIEETKETYYESLQSSSIGWMNGENDSKPFVRYMLGVVLKAYRTFEERVIVVTQNKLNKKDQVRAIFDNSFGKFTKAKIVELCPTISPTTIELYLKQLLDEKYIEKIGSGRATSYKKI